MKRAYGRGKAAATRLFTPGVSVKRERPDDLDASGGLFDDVSIFQPPAKQRVAIDMME